MCKLRFVLLFLLIFVTASGVSCGTSHGQLKSINISPGVAAGQAQFTATGTYADGHQVRPLDVFWSEGNPWVQNDTAPQELVVSQTGMASCNPLVGTFTIEATAPVNPYVPLSQMDMMTPQVHGTAQITCP